jgi:hypothetical protein
MLLAFQFCKFLAQPALQANACAALCGLSKFFQIVEFLTVSNNPHSHALDENPPTSDLRRTFSECCWSIPPSGFEKVAVTARLAAQILLRRFHRRTKLGGGVPRPARASSARALVGFAEMPRLWPTGIHKSKIDEQAEPPH